MAKHMMLVVSILAFHAGYLGSIPIIGNLFSHILHYPLHSNHEVGENVGGILQDTRAKAIYILDIKFISI
jgi:hypothetical protein